MKTNSARLGNWFGNHCRNLVSALYQCPDCGERRIDNLIIDDLDEHAEHDDGSVRCITCECIYQI